MQENDDGREWAQLYVLKWCLNLNFIQSLSMVFLHALVSPILSFKVFLYRGGYYYRINME